MKVKETKRIEEVERKYRKFITPLASILWLRRDSTLICCISNCQNVELIFNFLFYR